MPQGLWKEANWAQISDNGKISIPITRDQYEAKGYHPPFDQLPTKAQYEATHA